MKTASGAELLADAQAVSDAGAFAVVLEGMAEPLAAIDLRRGERIWDKSVGGTQEPWVAGDFVFVVDNGKGHQREVKTGISDGRVTVVVSGSVAAGEEVVTGAATSKAGSATSAVPLGGARGGAGGGGGRRGP